MQFDIAKQVFNYQLSTMLLERYTLKTWRTDCDMGYRASFNLW